MVTPISSAKPVKASIFYINDLHGQTVKMEKIKTAADCFERTTPKDVNKLTLSAGDIFLGHDLSKNSSATAFLNSINLDATAIGNHEFDVNQNDFLNLTKNMQFKTLGMNIKPKKEDEFTHKILPSYIQEKDGEKYGIIGLTPFDLKLRTKNNDMLNNLEVEDFNETLVKLQKQINEFKKQGINKIILLSHVGFDKDREFAKRLTDLDVIIGGHSHELIKDIKKNENLFYSKTGEPVVITQAGRDGGNFGILNLEFNQGGVITSVQNNIYETDKFRKDYPLQYVFNKYLGEAKVAGEIAKVEKYDGNFLVTENPNANFLADAIKSELKTDIAMINAANIRGKFVEGKVYDRDIDAITPFKNKMTIVTLNEKEIVDAIESAGVRSFKAENKKPGLIQVSGLKYTLNKSGTLEKLTYIDKTGKEKNIDVKNPDEHTFYTVGMDDFMSTGSDGFDMLNKIKTAQIFDFDKDKLAFDYLKKQTTPVEIKTENRIVIV